MSIYNEKFDKTLSKAQWVSKSSGGKPYLFKYAPHPDRAGYLFVATDMETVCFEALTATAIPARLGDVATRLNDFGAPQPGSLSLDEEQRQAEDTLAALEGVFEGAHGLAGVSVAAERDDYYDLVLVLKSPGLNWQFNLTEMRGRQPLAFLAKQLLTPFAALIADDRGVQITDDPAEAVSTIVSDPGVARAMRRLAGAPPHPSQPQSRHVSAAPGTPRRHLSPPARARTHTKSPDATPRPVTPSRPTATPGQPSHAPPSPTPYKKPYTPALVSSSSRPGSPEPPRHRRRVQDSLATEVSIPPSSPPRAAVPTSDTEVPTSDLPSSQMPMSTQDPLLPSQADADRPRRRKKRDKEAELAEEEEEADRRREEMKRKMKAGGAKKGGGLGRRRF